MRLASMPDAARSCTTTMWRTSLGVFPGCCSRSRRCATLASRTPVVAEVQEVRRRALTRLRELLRAARRPLPAGVAIDDLQWSDLDSTGLLSGCSAPPNPPRLLFLGSYRSEHADDAVTVLNTLSRSDPSRAADRGRAAVRARRSAALVAQHARRDTSTPPPSMPWSGKPAARPCSSRNSCTRSIDVGGVAHGDRCHSTSVLKRRLSAARRIEPPPPRARRRRRAAAATARDPARRGPRAGTGAPAISRRCARSSGYGPTASAMTSNVEPFHDRIRESIVGWHARRTPCSASPLGAGAGAWSRWQVDPEILAVHWSGCEHFRRSVALCDAGGRSRGGVARLQPRRALVRSGARLADLRLDRRARAQVAAGDALAHAGRSLEAGDAYLRAAEGSDVSPTALFYKQRAAEQYLNHGHVEKGYQVLEDLVRAVGLRMPKRGAHADRLAGLAAAAVAGPRTDRFGVAAG